jgi:uncharacterized protein YdeI (YjbR/CyaY-like superfamily)
MVKMGSKSHLLLILKDIRGKLGKEKGEKVHVVVKLDTEERKIELSKDIISILKQNPAAWAAWQKLAYSHQREYYQWIEQAKMPDTRT